MVASDYAAAFQQVTAAHGLHLHTAYTNGWTIQDGRLALQALPVGDGGITGIVALNEAMAVGLIQAAQDQGRPVPESLSVVSLGNTHLAEHFSPGITAIDLASRRIGQTLAAAMFRLIEDPRSPRASFIVPVRLVVRRSTGGIGLPTPVPAGVPAT